MNGRGTGRRKARGQDGPRWRPCSLAAIALALLTGCGSVAPGTPASPAAAASPSAPPIASPSSATALPEPIATPTTVPTSGPTVAMGGGDGIAIARSSVPRSVTTPEEATNAAAAVDAFGIELFRRVATGSGNLVVSPASIALALAMARAGARGETAAQMDAVLHGFGSDAHALGVAALDESLAALDHVYDSYPANNGQVPEVALQVANAPFAQQGMPLEPAYLDALASRFDAGLRLVDFRTDPDGARQLVNAWVKAQTKGRIPELLGPPAITNLTRLVLVNTIYLKAPWLVPFDEQATADEPFTRADGSSASVPTMSQRSEYGYAAGRGWWAVELPYLGTLALTIIMPDDLPAFTAGLTATELARIMTATATLRPFDLHVPRFGIDTGPLDLSEALSAMGMPLAFDQQRADFSGITAAERLFISHVVHQATIDVDEKGTEAAAATAVTMATGGPGYQGPWPELRVDRPFLFALHDRSTGAVLFLGRVTDPSRRS